MIQRDVTTVRVLRPADLPAVRRILDTSEYIHYRFEPQELAGLLAKLPAVGAFSVAPGALGRVTGGTLQAFLLVNWLVPPSAWIGGFGVTWSQGAHFGDYLGPLLQRLATALAASGVRTLYYSGSDIDNDWLCDVLEVCGFELTSLLRSYDKSDFTIPSQGSQRVRVRPFRPEDPADAAGVVAVENAAFAQLWRHDVSGFLEVARTYPYFVVAEDGAGIVGYQFNTIDAITGYLVRIAVHPRAEGHGVGTRLMAEAIRYFERQHVWKIVLNTEEQNTRAHALYERFGFRLVPPRGFVLGRPVEPGAAASGVHG
jgi:ribosomal-protein-alanine N-acetyltransferase